MLLLGLTTGHKIGLLTMGLVFITFSLAASFVAPRRWPDFPRRFFSVFIVTCFVLFALMIGAVEIFAVEGGEAKASEPAASGKHNATYDVSETEFRIALPSLSAKQLAKGTYTFRVKNDGKQVHNFVVDGPKVPKKSTPNLDPGRSASLRVALVTGTYTLYCSIPGHRQLGMVAKLQVG